MFHTIEECTNFIFQLKASTYKGEPLEAIGIILTELGNPQETVKFIHIAGSNGKGSTVNATREILMEHGLTVGAFTSPHLEFVNERVTINKEPISDEVFLHYANKISTIIDEKLHGQYPSFFEIMTVIALLYFSKRNVDVALIETGIGGRIDSTNVITPEVSVITTISLEHTEILGDTLQKVAYEKAGIIKEGKPVVIGVKQQEALDIIFEKATNCHAPVYVLNQEIELFNIRKNSPQLFDYKSQQGTINDIPLAMQGAHQIENAALAITAALAFDSSIEASTIRQALKNARWEGRFEQVTEQVIIDGAHNSEGTEALLNTLLEFYPNKHYHFIYAALSDKDHEKSIHLMDEVAASMSFTEISIPRAARAKDLANQSTHSFVSVDENWQRLIEKMIANLQEEDLLVITGSLYFISDVRQFLLEMRQHDPQA
ncbi:bifunctional folylpolyglutamate synthase/dihydrofolate synthase [Lysinibacillus antri]|uniref:tetrahydrofolate synthase n=1 Tax=Lysinibacillus antri TaxID=2498145 RepID=A0A3S0RID7_9BACI|nr:folylpolyglutamate synthase/dihydrofolate synthase family protein [Lysinibacillus antri]RUL51063.1 bifunctional folylpolyglutamate synthase/dihydrofolate synthase [Lysinibacillus antri]